MYIIVRMNRMTGVINREDLIKPVIYATKQDACNSVYDMPDLPETYTYEVLEVTDK